MPKDATLETTLFEIRSRVIDDMLKIVSVLGVPALAASLSRIQQTGYTQAMLAQSIALIVVWCLFLFRNRIRFWIRSSVLLSLFLLLGIDALLSYGLSAAGRDYIIVFIVFATLIYGLRAGLAGFAASVIFVVFFGIAVTRTWVTFPIDFNVYNTALSSWVALVSSWVLFIGPLIVVANRLYSMLIDALTTSRQQTDEIRQKTVELQKEITERKKAEEALKQSEATARALINAPTDSIFLLDTQGVILDLNMTAAQKLGKRREELIGARADTVLPAGVAQTRRERIARVIETNREVRFEDERNGVWFDTVAFPILNDAGDVIRLAIIARDITERRRAEEALRQSEERFRTIYEHAPVLIDAFDKNGRCILWNKECEKVFGWTMDEINAQDEPLALFYPDPVARRKVSGTVFHKPDKAFRESNPRAKDGKELTQLWANFQVPDGTVINIGYDVTERKRAEEEREKLQTQLWQARKAESLGRMAGAIAHHYNNLMGILIGNLDLTLTELPAGSGIRGNIAEAMKASRRAADISQLMLAYLGQSTGKKEPMDLSQACRDALPSLTAVVPESLRVRTEFPVSGPFIRGNAVQIKQVLSNLVTNAVEAMGEGKGEITVTIAEIPATDIPVSTISPTDWKPKAEAYACLSIADTGGGMDRETVDKVFDPFFSTKFTGRGLGVPVVAGVVKAHEGAVAVDSIPGQGTVFRVFLPVTMHKPLESMTAAPVEPVAVEGRGLVLLVEDDPMLRDTAQRMLKWLGYDSITAADGVEAVEVFRRRRNQIRCVFLDLTMPRMGGWETLEGLRKIRPDAPVVLASGYDEAQVMGGEHTERPQAFLHKPYTLANLKVALSAALRE